MSGKNRRLVADELVELRNKRLKLETSGELLIILEESIEEYTTRCQNKVEPEDVNIQPVGFRITRILTDYAQKLPGPWYGHFTMSIYILGNRPHLHMGNLSCVTRTSEL